MSDDETVSALPSPQRPEIVDPHHVDALFTDWIVTQGLHEGVVNVTFAALDFSFRQTSEMPPRAVITHRMRFSYDFAKRLHQSLGILLGIEKPPENPNSAPIPTSLMN